MKPIMIATTNPGKFVEMKMVLDDFVGKIFSPKDFPGVSPPDETGNTFEENAILKAKYYFEKTGLASVADDGGLEIDALDGFPGVKSNRFLGYDASDKELAKGIIQKMNGLPREKRSARLTTVVAFYDGKNLITQPSFIEGYITEKIPNEIHSGYPYRSIFVVQKFEKLFKDLSEEEHQAMNHRRKNLESLRSRIIRCLEI